MAQALYRKWRPHRWEQVVGQEHVVQTLRSAIAAERVAHAYLFAGPRGTGKTTTARLLAKAINCIHPELSARPCDECKHCEAVNQGRFLDLIEIDAASNTSVEDVRDLRDKINFSPNQGKFKVYIIDEIHMLSTAAFNALLKTLEEPPAHAIFILATTEVHKIPATVLSRCQRHEFRRIPVNDIAAHLREMARGENLQVEEEALALVARQATGSLRDAISLLDQLASSGSAISLEMAQMVLGTAASQAVIDVVEAAFSKDAAGLEHIHRTLDAGSDPRQFARQIVEYMRGLLLIQMGSASQIEAPADVKAVMARHAQSLPTEDLLAAIKIFNHAAAEARLSWQPSLPLELAFVEVIERSDVVATTAPAPAVRPQSIQRAAAEKPRSKSQTPAAEQEQAELPAESGGLTMDMIRKHWRRVLELVRASNPNTQGLLNSCAPLGVKDGILYLGFNSNVLIEKMEKPDHMELTQGVLAQVFNMHVPVRCIVSTTRRGLPPDIDTDGMVAAALRDLGGEIVDIQ
jgi:DNA polymerase III subunit gamma/tau